MDQILAGENLAGSTRHAKARGKTWLDFLAFHRRDSRMPTSCLMPACTDGDVDPTQPLVDRMDADSCNLSLLDP